MKLWKDNRLDQAYERPNREIANEFLASDYYKSRHERGLFIEQALVLFITGKDGLSSTWEWDERKGSINGSPDMLEILKMVESLCPKCDLRGSSMCRANYPCPCVEGCHDCVIKPYCSKHVALEKPVVGNGRNPRIANVESGVSPNQKEQK